MSSFPFSPKRTNTRPPISCQNAHCFLVVFFFLLEISSCVLWPSLSHGAKVFNKHCFIVYSILRSSSGPYPTTTSPPYCFLPAFILPPEPHPAPSSHSQTILPAAVSRASCEDSNQLRLQLINHQLSLTVLCEVRFKVVILRF